MSVLICKLTGNRGRRIDVYDNKCVITTDATLGSLITNNALDGQKTIFYIDVIGVQFKYSGLTIGYLQLETPSIQMNNQNSNMFSENTFTFQDGSKGVTNSLMATVRDYIVSRMEMYKYNAGESKTELYQLIAALENAGDCYLNKEIATIVACEKKEYETKQEQIRAEENKAKQEAQQRAREELNRRMQETGEATCIPVVTGPHEVMCPICGKKQNANRTNCWKCGTRFAIE